MKLTCVSVVVLAVFVSYCAAGHHERHPGSNVVKKALRQEEYYEDDSIEHGDHRISIRSTFNRNLKLRRGRNKIGCQGTVGCASLRMNRRTEGSGAQFFLFTRANPENPQPLVPGSNMLLRSNYNPKRPTKVIIHGVREQQTNGKLSVENKNVFLALDDCNVVLVDWRRGAKLVYPRAVVSSRVVGSQLTRLVEQMLGTGANASEFHLVGFSLGAHIAGYVGEALAKKAIMLGRITGLDPAGLFFEGESVPGGVGLDRSDADFVEVIHTDGGPITTGGVSINQAIGHVDYYPNGGLGQKNCLNINLPDVLEGSLTLSRVINSHCSHARSWQMYLEALTGKCRFVGFPCPGLQNFERDFVHGECFSCENNTCGAIAQDNPGQGSLYLVTRSGKTLCGEQLRAAIEISDKTIITRGELRLQLDVNGRFAKFDMNSDSTDVIKGGETLSTVIATEPGLLTPTENQSKIMARLSYKPYFTMKLLGPNNIYFNKITITDETGDSWYYCGNNTLLEDKIGTSTDHLTLELEPTPCSTSPYIPDEPTGTLEAATEEAMATTETTEVEEEVETTTIEEQETTTSAVQ